MVADDTDRGQLLLIAAVLVATTIVGSVVLLNSVHADADVNAQKEGNSLEQAERATAQIQRHLRTIFFANTSKDGEPAPFIEDGEKAEFEAEIETYSEQYANLSTTGTSGIVWVRFDPAASAEEGLVLQQTGGDDFVSEDGGRRNNFWDPVTNANDIPYMYFNITAVDPDGVGQVWMITLNEGAENERLRAVDEGPGEARIEIDRGDGWEVVCDSASNPISTPFQMEFTDGEGTIQTGGESCEGLEFGAFDTTDLRFEDPRGAQGNYTIVATGSLTDSDTEMDDSDGERTVTEDDIIVNPAFQIRYEDPNIDYTATVSVFEGDD